MTVDMDDGGRVAIYSCGKHEVHPAGRSCWHVLDHIVGLSSVEILLNVKGNIPRISSYTWLFAKNTGWCVVL